MAHGAVLVSGRAGCLVTVRLNDVGARHDCEQSGRRGEGAIRGLCERGEGQYGICTNGRGVRGQYGSVSEG